MSTCKITETFESPQRSSFNKYVRVEFLKGTWLNLLNLACKTSESALNDYPKITLPFLPISPWSQIPLLPKFTLLIWILSFNFSSSTLDLPTLSDPAKKNKIPAKSIKLILENWLLLSPWPDRNIWKIRWEREECSFEQVEEVERFRVPDSISFRTWSLGIRG